MTDINYSKISVKELAALIGKKLKEHNIDVVLVGGACVTIYSHDRYQSSDLDFVTCNDIKKVQTALAELGFFPKNKYLAHQGCPFLIEFVTPPVSVGREQIKQFEYLKTSFGEIKLLTPTDCVKDRLASYYHWDDIQALKQAIMVSQEQDIDIKAIQQWSKQEGFLDKFEEYKKMIKSSA